MTFFTENAKPLNLLFINSTFYPEYSKELIQNGIDCLVQQTFKNFQTNKLSIVTSPSENLTTIFLGDMSEIAKAQGLLFEVVNADKVSSSLAKVSLENQIMRFSFKNLTNKEMLNFSIIKILGSFEMPQVANFSIIKMDNLDGIVAFGIIKKGQTSHDSYVASECYRGLNTVALNHSVPITTAIINTDSEDLIKERISSKGQNIGKQAVQTCLDIINIKNKINILF